MKLSFKNISIKIKLTLIILIVSTISLILSGVFFLAFDKSEFEYRTIQNLSILAEIIGNNNSAALLFDDKETAFESISSLKANKHIQKAAIYTKKGIILAEYSRSIKTHAPLLSIQKLAKDSYVLDNNTLKVIKPILFDNELIGSIYIESDLTELSDRISEYIKIVLLILISALFIAFIIALKLQTIISHPIIKLTNVMKGISINKDFSIRINKRANDEIGELIEGFNQMLSQIEKQNLALTLAKEGAESSSKIKRV